MTRVADVAFHIKCIVAERGARLRRCGAEGRRYFGGVPNELDSAAAPARGSFEQNRVSDLLGKSSGFVRVARVIRTGHRSHAGNLRDAARLKLVALLSDVISSGSDVRDLIVSAGLGDPRSF